MKSPPYSLPEGRLGRRLAFSITFVLLLVAFLYVVMPVIDWFQSRQDQLAAAQKVVSHMSEAIRATSELEDQVARMRGGASHQTFLLTGDSEAAAAANLQSLIKVIAVQNNIELSSTSLIPSENINSLEKINVEESFSATWPAFVIFLNAINQAAPPLVVSNLTIDGSQQIQEIGVDAPLQISCLVSGFWGDGIF
jgi:hypothetical protein